MSSSRNIGLKLVFVLAALALGAVGVVDRANAEEKEKEAPTVDPRLGKKMAKAHDLIQKEKYIEARRLLEEVSKARFISPYEKARAETLLAFVAQGEHKLDEARNHLKKAIESEGLNDQELITTHYQIAQLYLADEKWKEGVEEMIAWEKVGGKPTPDSTFLLAVAHYQMKKFKTALQYAEKAVSMSDTPKDAWLQLLLSLRLEGDQFKEALPVLLQILERQPTKGAYWMQLSNIYSMLNKYDDGLMAAQIAYTGGYVANEENSIKRLVDLLLFANIPYRAGEVLEGALKQGKVQPIEKNWGKLGTCWLAAREFDKAVDPLGKATEKVETGEPFIRLAEVHIEREDWTKAIRALNQAMDKGKLKNEVDVYIMMGSALANLKKYGEAKGYFQRALSDKRTNQAAQNWISYIDSEVEKNKQREADKKQAEEREAKKKQANQEGT